MTQAKSYQHSWLSPCHFPFQRHLYMHWPCNQHGLRHCLSLLEGWIHRSVVTLPEKYFLVSYAYRSYSGLNDKLYRQQGEREGVNVCSPTSRLGCFVKSTWFLCSTFLFCIEILLFRAKRELHRWVYLLLSAGVSAETRCLSNVLLHGPSEVYEKDIPPSL